ncbi:MAG: 1,4-dihydroxy-2-naphthoate octaprenyltransferase [Planctomycetota bacterium]|jgi:1,4-dihydroxy-2-naphthoate octaprenyltransferase|uniref:1,4-dihydroxy-2-naphthoate octaprenyltransferase n=1 Tax=Patiriisocius sp. Uisw_047 TaxID=3230969 RepID=UPI0039EAC747
MQKVKAWISAARLRTLPLSISGILMAAAAAVNEGEFSMVILILALLTTLGFQVLSNFANDYGDGKKGTDNKDRVGPVRAMQGGLLNARELKRGMIVTAIITILLSTMLIFQAFGSDNLVLAFIFFNLGIAAIIAAVKYTVGDNAYGYRAMGDVFVFIFFGLVGVVGCYFLFTTEITSLIFLPAMTIGLLSTAVLNLNNMRDRIPDRAVNKNTLAVVLGGKKVKYYHYALLIGAAITAVLYSYLAYDLSIAFLPIIALFPMIFNAIKVYKNKIPALLDPELKKVALSTFFFAFLHIVVSFWL